MKVCGGGNMERAIGIHADRLYLNVYIYISVYKDTSEEPCVYTDARASERGT